MLRRSLALVAVASLVGVDLRAAPVATDAPSPPRVVVVRKPNLQTYEQTVEEFRGRVLGSVHVLPVRPDGAEALATEIAAVRPSLIYAVGQLAYDQVRGLAGRPIIVSLAFHRLRPEHPLAPQRITPADVLPAFLLARRDLRLVGVLHGPDATAYVDEARGVAARRGLRLRSLLARTAAQAISQLRTRSGGLEGLWLLPDLQLLQPQVLQYALVLQFRRRIPLMGATRRHTAQGALFAVDHDPSAIGREAALLANRILSATPAATPRPVSQRPQLSVNLATAQRLGVSASALNAQAAQVYR
jgi:hypothetical protein